MTQALRLPALLYPALFFFLLFLPDIFSFNGQESLRNAHIHRTTHDTYSRNSIFYLNAQMLRARFAPKGLSALKYTTRCLLIGLSVGLTITALLLSSCRPATVCILYEVNCRYLDLSCCLHHWSPQGPQQHCSQLHTIVDFFIQCMNIHVGDGSHSEWNIGWLHKPTNNFKFPASPSNQVATHWSTVMLSGLLASCGLSTGVSVVVSEAGACVTVVEGEALILLQTQ